MKYKLILFLFFTSCINSTYTSKNNFTYYANGFALIENDSFKGLDGKLFATHHRLKSGTKIRITNPSNGLSIEVIVQKKIKFDNFYKVLISADTAEKLKLNLRFPYVEIAEIKKNKSFVAKKAITQNIEKKIANKAPIEKININNLSKKKYTGEPKTKTYSILVAEFYNLESVGLLQKRLVTILENSNNQLIYVNKNNDKSYELLMGPYNTINKLKNDYSVLSNSGFEDIDIKIND
jgi:hypothetical protein